MNELICEYVSDARGLFTLFGYNCSGNSENLLQDNIINSQSAIKLWSKYNNSLFKTKHMSWLLT